MKQETSVETPEQIAEQILAPTTGKVAPAVYRELVKEVVEALRARDERAVRIINEHQALDVCKDNCWTTIKAAIRKGE